MNTQTRREKKKKKWTALEIITGRRVGSSSYSTLGSSLMCPTWREKKMAWGRVCCWERGKKKLLKSREHISFFFFKRETRGRKEKNKWLRWTVIFGLRERVPSPTLNLNSLFCVSFFSLPFSCLLSQLNGCTYFYRFIFIYLLLWLFFQRERKEKKCWNLEQGKSCVTCQKLFSK